MTTPTENYTKNIEIFKNINERKTAMSRYSSKRSVFQTQGDLYSKLNTDFHKILIKIISL